jgi:hypothetical protein
MGQLGFFDADKRLAGGVGGGGADFSGAVVDRHRAAVRGVAGERLRRGVVGGIHIAVDHGAVGRCRRRRRDGGVDGEARGGGVRACGSRRVPKISSLS